MTPPRALLFDLLRSLARPADFRAPTAEASNDAGAPADVARSPRVLREVSDDEMAAAIARFEADSDPAVKPGICDDADCDCGNFSRLRYTPRKNNGNSKRHLTDN